MINYEITIIHDQVIILETFLDNITDRFDVVGKVGIALGIICTLLGTILYCLERRKRKLFMSKIYID